MYYVTPYFKSLLGILGILTVCCCAALSAGGQWTYELSNGMKVFIFEDHSSPLASSVIGVRAGSRMETNSSNGLSHLLEHLLFDGTQTRTRKQLETDITSQGGYFNAFTRKDYVAFELVMPSASFGKGLEVQADQLLNSIIPDTELEKERKVVCEEIAKDANDSSGAADDAAMERLFGRDGYGLPVIGNYTTVSSISRIEIERFYTSRYVPNRMVAVITGDVDPQVVYRKLESLYGRRSKGPEPIQLAKIPHFPESDPVETLKRPVRSSICRFVFPAPLFNDQQSLHLEMALQLWAEGSESPLVQTMTNGDAAPVQQISAYIDHYDGFSLLTIDVVPSETEASNPAGERVTEILDLICRSATEFVSAAPDPSALQRLIMRSRVDMQSSKEKFHHWGRDIVHHLALSAENTYVEKETWLKNLSVEQVQASAKTWLPIRNVTPMAGVWIEPSGAETAFQPTESMPECEMKKLGNGLTVITQYDPYAPLTGLHLLTPAQGNIAPVMVRIVSEMLDRGTSDHTASDISRILDENGLRVKLADEDWLPFDDYYYSPDYAYFRMECLPEKTEVAFNVMAEMAFDSVMPETGFEEVRRHMRMLSRQRDKKPEAMTRDLLESMIFPQMIAPLIPPADAIQKITLDEVKTYYQSAYVPSNCILSVTGSLDMQHLFDLAQTYFGSLQLTSDSTLAGRELIPSVKPESKTIAVESEQGYIRCAVPVGLTPAEIPRMEVAAFILSDLLQDTIREKKGMAYRLGAGLSVRRGATILGISVGTRKQNLQEVTSDIRIIIDLFRKHRFTDEEIRLAINAITGEALRYRQPRVNRAYYLGWTHHVGLDIKNELNIMDQYTKINAESVTALIKSKIPAAAEWFWVEAH